MIFYGGGGGGGGGGGRGRPDPFSPHEPILVNNVKQKGHIHVRIIPAKSVQKGSLPINSGVRLNTPTPAHPLFLNILLRPNYFIFNGYFIKIR